MPLAAREGQDQVDEPTISHRQPDTDELPEGGRNAYYHPADSQYRAGESALTSQPTPNLDESTRGRSPHPRGRRNPSVESARVSRRPGHILSSRPISGAGPSVRLPTRESDAPRPPSSTPPPPVMPQIRYIHGPMHEPTRIFPAAPSTQDNPYGVNPSQNEPIRYVPGLSARGRAPSPVGSRRSNYSSRPGPVPTPGYYSPFIPRNLAGIQVPYSTEPPVIPSGTWNPWSEQPYVSVDPFKYSSRNESRPNYPYSGGYVPPSPATPGSPSERPDLSDNPTPGQNRPSRPNTSMPMPVLTPPLRRPRYRRTWRYRLADVLSFLLILFFVRVPRQIYLHVLLRLPSLYFSRVSRLFEDAELSLPDIRRMAVANANQWRDNTPGALLTTWLPPDSAVPPHLLNFKYSWEGFIDSLIREWKTQNVIATLMLSAILTMLQIDAAAADPIARTTALLSLICALMSVLFGSMYIIRFGTMRKMYKAATWADEAQKSRQSILWNVWILLAIPGVWMAWSIILFVTCIMAFAWRTGAANDPEEGALSHNAALGLRIGTSALLVVALVYFILIIRTFRKYGDSMDKKWNEKVIQWAHEGRYPAITTQPGYWEPDALKGRSSLRGNRYSRPYGSGSSFEPAPIQRSDSSGPRRGRHSSVRPRGPDPAAPPTPALPFDRPFENKSDSASLPLFDAVKVMDLVHGGVRTYPRPNDLRRRDILLSDWDSFITALGNIWFDDIVVAPISETTKLMTLWNEKFFEPRSTHVILCDEEPNIGVRNHAVYIVHRSPQGSYGPMPSPQTYGLKTIAVVQLNGNSDSVPLGERTKIASQPSNGRRSRASSPSRPKHHSNSSFYVVDWPPSTPSESGPSSPNQRTKDTIVIRAS
ncbi:hypothetical protein R3P38DRAFT_2910716 [Favolaschia claudopus]|uniref:Uncharacterized protein n=1 Tax=Favolaschia claudopus TaxID=2862362 RepID=A0AAW0CC18_9AGAR